MAYSTPKRAKITTREQGIQAMISTKPTGMHQEHRYWENEIGLWRDDLRAWQKELAKAESEIKLLEKALADHAQVLRLHGSSLRLDEQEFENHEHEIVEFEKGGEGDELFEMARRHSAQAMRHDEHRAAHEQLKRRHHNILAHWNVLLKALRETAETPAPPAKKFVTPSS
jgi:hypothetical protein